MSLGLARTDPPSQKGLTVEWYTPRRIFDALGLTFDLDPASPMEGPLPWVPAQTFFTANEDGLRQPWAGRVWLNPPYGRSTRNWLAKLARHGEGMALVFARTDTNWFQEAIASASLVCFIKGRVAFVDRHERSSGSPGAPSCLIAYGDSCAEALRRSNLGILMGRSA